MKAGPAAIPGGHGAAEQGWFLASHAPLFGLLVTMDIVHHAQSEREHAIEPILDELAIPHRAMHGITSAFAVVSFEVPESHPHWQFLSRLIDEKAYIHAIDTDFTREEILEAEWVRVLPGHQTLYPQPEDDMRFHETTSENLCPTCGAGFTQKAPYRVRMEPSMGRNSFLCL